MLLRSLKSKILLVYFFLILLISFIAVISIYNLYSLNKAIDGLIESNYRSIIAATNMIDAIERQDSNQLVYLQVDQQKGLRAFSENQKEFFLWLSRANDNITEKSEREILANISNDYTRYIEYFSKLQEIKNTSGIQDATLFYDNEIYPIFYSVKDSCRRLLATNEEAMFNSKELATINSRDQMYATIIISICSIILGMSVAIYFTRNTINPIYTLMSGIKSIKEGNLHQEIEITTHDEIGELAIEFNNMTKRLLQYDRSNLKNLISERNKSLAIVKSIEDPILVIDNEYKIILVNKSAESVFDIKEREVLGRHILETISDRHIFESIRDMLLQKSDSERENDSIIFQKGSSTYYYILTVTSILNDDNDVNGIVCVFQDITHLKKIEQMKSDFISTVSHELRTPLTSIIMGTKLLLDYTEELKEDQKEIIEAIDEDSNQLMLLVNDLLDLSKAESGKMHINLEKASIYDIIELSIRPLYDMAQSREILLVHDVSPDLPPVYVDYKKIKVVINNLVINALKFTLKGGTVTISAKVRGNFIHVSVKDSGVGIPEEYHKKIFEKFNQVGDVEQSEGTGLGLAIAKEFIKKHNGEIWVESKPGVGSQFIFTLPLYRG